MLTLRKVFPPLSPSKRLVCQFSWTGLSVPMALYGIFMHLEHFSKPDEQRHIIRVLWMVPIYSLNSWGALILGSDDVCRPGDTIYLDTVRECYEGYAIYNFVAYIEAFLIREYKQDPSKLLQSHPQQKHLFPFCFLPKWKMGESFYMHCKYVRKKNPPPPHHSLSFFFLIFYATFHDLRMVLDDFSGTVLFNT